MVSVIKNIVENRLVQNVVLTDNAIDRKMTLWNYVAQPQNF